MEMPGRFDFGEAWRDGVLDDFIREIDVAFQEAKRLRSVESGIA